MSKEEKNDFDVIKNLEGNSKEKEKFSYKKEFKENSDDNIYFIVYYSKNSSEEIRQILNKKILDLKIFEKIEPKILEDIFNKQNVYFFFFNIDKKMIRALMKKENKIKNNNEQIRLEWQSR